MPTQHTVSEVPITSIQLTTRQRRDYGDVTSLAESLKKFGLIHAICLTEDNYLVAGGRRLQAARSLSWSTIPARVLPFTSSQLETDETLKATAELLMREYELEENIQRKDLSWQERTKATEEIHKLKTLLAGGEVPGYKERKTWTQKDTAQTIGAAEGKISQDLSLAKAMEFYPELESCSTKKEALRKLKELQLRAMQSTLAENIVETSDEIEIYNMDCIAGMAGLEAESVDFINADPPFAIGLDDSSMFRESMNIYRDNSSDVLALYRRFAPLAYKVLKPSRYMVFWFGMTWYHEVYKILTEAGFTVDVLPGFWFKGQATHTLSKTWLGMSYEAFFLCKKGHRDMTDFHINVFSHSFHIKEKTVVGFPEKPIALMEEMFKLFALPEELVLSPFAGSGVDLETAAKLGMHAIGFEMDNNRYNAIKVRLSKLEQDFNPRDEGE